MTSGVVDLPNLALVASSTNAEVVLSAVNALCNTIQVVALAYIGAVVTGSRREDREAR